MDSRSCERSIVQVFVRNDRGSEKVEAKERFPARQGVRAAETHHAGRADAAAAEAALTVAAG